MCIRDRCRGVSQLLSDITNVDTSHSGKRACKEKAISKILQQDKLKLKAHGDPVAANIARWSEQPDQLLCTSFRQLLINCLLLTLEKKKSTCLLKGM